MFKQEAMNDVWSMTGSNFRTIMLLLGKTNFFDVTFDDAARNNYYQFGRGEHVEGADCKGDHQHQGWSTETSGVYAT